MAFDPLKADLIAAASSRSAATISTPLSDHTLLEALEGSRLMPRIFQPASLRKASATEAPWDKISKCGMFGWHWE
jgi:hypothetical protein